MTNFNLCGFFTFCKWRGCEMILPCLMDVALSSLTSRKRECRWKSAPMYHGVERCRLKHRRRVKHFALVRPFDVCGFNTFSTSTLCGESPEWARRVLRLATFDARRANDRYNAWYNTNSFRNDDRSDGTLSFGGTYQHGQRQRGKGERLTHVKSIFPNQDEHNYIVLQRNGGKRTLHIEYLLCSHESA